MAEALPAEDEDEEVEGWLRVVAAEIESPGGLTERAAFSLLGVRAGDVLADRYRIVGRIGAGAMGAVFEAEQEALGRRVALKVMREEVSTDPQFRTRFHREALAAARVDHPNVVEVVDFGIHGDRPFLVMELLEGETLRSRLQRGRMDVAELQAVMVPTLSALAAAHDRGVVHRDVKPDNIFLSAGADEGDVVPKMLDFGIAKLEMQTRLTGTGGAIGTPAYMAPEQLEGGAGLGAAVDQYAAATILFEALAGRLPYGGEGHPPVAAKSTTAAPSLRTLRSDLPRGLSRAIDRGLARSPSDRHDDVRALAHALAHPEEDAGAGRRSWVAMAVLAVVAALLGGWVVFGDGPPEEPATAEHPTPRGERAQADPSAPSSVVPEAEAVSAMVEIATPPEEVSEPEPQPPARHRARRSVVRRAPAQAVETPPQEPPLGANDAPILH